VKVAGIPTYHSTNSTTIIFLTYLPSHQAAKAAERQREKEEAAAEEAELKRIRWVHLPALHYCCFA
jgi:hypothetical protein